MKKKERLKRIAGIIGDVDIRAFKIGINATTPTTKEEITQEELAQIYDLALNTTPRPSTDEPENTD